MIKSDRFWAVMKAYDFSTLTVCGIPLSAPGEGPHKYIPLFYTRDEAVAFAGDSANVREMVTQEKGDA